MKFRFLFIPIVAAIFFSCQNQQSQIPILGAPIETKNGTEYPTIKPFSFVDQDSTIITNKTFENKIYVADFFFLNCGTICPKMTKQMKRLYNEFKDEPNVFFLSHTIDPQHDSVKQLKQHALLLGVETTKWHFVTGNEDSIYNIAEHSYYSSAHADSTADGGLIHSGGFILIDKNKNVRGIYDGTDPTATAKLMITIKTLLKEQFQK
ncbi:MAG: hypothetical protein RL708_2615 [Bacteroidota bacterium]|jgi:protein SCO1/2